MKLFHIDDPLVPNRPETCLNFNFDRGFEMSKFMMSIASLCERSRQQGHIIWNSSGYTVTLWLSDPKIESIVLLQAPIPQVKQNA